MIRLYIVFLFFIGFESLDITQISNTFWSIDNGTQIDFRQSPPQVTEVVECVEVYQEDGLYKTN
ncbi:MAG: hypothetical protein V3V14_07750 [Saprospiraceae bacterium]